MAKYRYAFGILALLVAAASAAAQRANVGVQEGPYYVGEPVVIQVTAEGFDDEPECAPGSVPSGMSIRFAGVNSSQQRSITIINGRRAELVRVTYLFNYQAVANAPGTYRIPSFTVSGGKHRATTRTFDLPFQEIEADQNMRVALIIPSTPIYPGQRVPITIEWWYAGNVEEVQNLNIRSPLFDQFTFVDEPNTRDDRVLPIATEKGRLGLKATLSKRTLNGREFLVWSANRVVVIDKPGEHELRPITANIAKVTRWRRGFFGRREAAATRRVRAVGEPQKLIILSLPLDQAPSSFAGAVGRGFSISVKADRSVVRVGDPITLTVTVRGDGNLESVGLPPLSVAVKDGMLDPNQFRLPDDDVAGTLLPESNGKQFLVSVRVLDESVVEIPPITYSWFDPEQSAFQTAYSDPIALRVLPTQMVGAQDVVSASSEQPGPESSDTGVSSSAIDMPADTKSRRLDLTGADLAIQPDPARLFIDDSQRLGGDTVRWAIYLGSVVLVVVAWLRQRAAAIDPELVRRRKHIKQQIGRIVQAAKLPRQRAAAQIAAALRQIAAHAVDHQHTEQRRQIDLLLADCDVLAYAPDVDNAQTIDAGLHDRATTVAQSIATEAA